MNKIKTVLGIVGLLGSLAFAMPAFAGVAGSVAPDFPSPLTVGQTGVAVSLTISNASTDTNALENVTVSTIMHAPSCGSSLNNTCQPVDADTGVFTVHNGTGRVGTACAGTAFTASAPDVNGNITFTPGSTVILGPANPGGLAAQCIIDFTVDVLSVPTKDSNGTAGIQTKQLGSAHFEANTSGDDGNGSGSDTTTVIPQGNIIVDKVTVPAESEQIFDFVTTGAGYSIFSLTDESDPNDQTLDAGVYSVSETVPNGWTQTSATCVSSIDDEETPGTLELDAGETITCTFTNTLDQGKIELQKDFSGTPESVTLEIGTTEGGSETDSAVLNDDGTTGENTVAPGTYYVNETLTTPANYTSVLACYNDINDNDEVDGDDTSRPFVEETGAVEVGNGDDVICVYTNTFNPGNIIVIKQTDPEGDLTEFEFDPSYGDNFMLSDDGENDSGDLTPGTYSVAELAETGWTSDDGVCDSTDEADTSTPESIDLDGGETVTCTFTNTKDAEKGRIIIVKETDPEGDATEFEFDTDYGDNFMLSDGEENDSGELDAGTYSVAEVNMADNWELTSATCDDSSEIDNIELGEGETVTCTFTNTLTPPVTWCSPGYWKNHLDSWEATGISQNDLYSDHFDPITLSKKAQKAGAPADPTLLEVVSNPQWYGGPAANNVGDLLSDAHPDVNFEMGEDDRVEDSCTLN